MAKAKTKTLYVRSVKEANIKWLTKRAKKLNITVAEVLNRTLDFKRQYEQS